MIAVDTNLLVYAHRAGLAEHLPAQAAIERAASASAGWCIPWPCLLEFWSVVTHPSCAGGPTTPRRAREFIESLVEGAGAAVLQPGAGFAGRCVRAAERLGVQGPRVFDLQIGMLCREGGAEELWTHDAGFLAVPGLRVVDPL